MARQLMRCSVWFLGSCLIGVLHGVGDFAVGNEYLSWWQELPSMAAGGAVCCLTAWAVR